MSEKSNASLKQIRKKFLEHTILDPGRESIQHILDQNREPLLLEKRRRQQIYKTLEHLSHQTSWFDFFNKETIELIKKAKHLAYLIDAKDIGSDLLLFAFLFSDCELVDIFEEFGITWKTLPTEISKKYKARDLSFEEKLSRIFCNFFYKKKLQKNFTDKKFSYELQLLFEQAVDNSIERFKTPVITPEILLITLMETASFKSSKIMKKLLGQGVRFSLFRFKLLKRLHREETSIRNEVLPSQTYFAYLLKIHLRMLEVTNLVDWSTFKYNTAFFRFIIVSQTLNFSIEQIVKREARKTIRCKLHKRKYSS